MTDDGRTIAGQGAGNNGTAIADGLARSGRTRPGQILVTRRKAAKLHVREG